MAEELFEPEIITLTDEEGNETQFEIIASYEMDGVGYLALVPTENNEEGEYVILRLEADPENEGEEILVTIDDDEEFDKIADIFDDMLFEDDGE
ncbi:MAG: DUF1292 domain-containing protein [Clostridia bacterium]|nr:DUF1292 domain-containing protein [Clostridia bacterium]